MALGIVKGRVGNGVVDVADRGVPERGGESLVTHYGLVIEEDGIHCIPFVVEATVGHI